jgi:hypothetical protein
MTLNHQAVHDAAAQLFWHMARQVGVQAANSQVIQTKGKCLTSMPLASSLLDEYEFENVPDSVQKQFLEAIETEACSYAEEEQNLQGMIYIEDAATGRSPSAKDLSTAHLSRQPVSLHVSRNIPKVGRLCVRAPLPAVVYSDVPAEAPFIWVEDTATALGFDSPMFLTGINCIQIAEDMYVYTGIFSIAVPDFELGAKWHQVVPNSSRFVDEISGFVGDQPLSVKASWG